MTRQPMAVRLCRYSVRLYPRAFRDEYGADMVDLVARLCVDESSAVVFGRTVRDLIVNVPRLHREKIMQRPTAHLATLVTLAALAASIAGLTVGFLAGTNGPVVATGMALFIIGLAAAAATLRKHPWQHSPADRGRGWWQLTLAGPLLVGAVILAAKAGVDAWFVGLICVLMAIGLSAAGVGLGVARLLTRRQYSGGSGPGAVSA